MGGFLVLVLVVVVASAAHAAAPSLYWSSPKAGAATGWPPRMIDCTSGLCAQVSGGGDPGNYQSYVEATTNITSAAPRWSSAPTLTAPGDVVPAVSCPSSGLCVALDQYGDVYYSHDPGDASPVWAGVAGAGPDSGLICPSTTLCVGISQASGEVYVTGAPTGPASGWSGTSVSPSNGLNGVACSASGLCVAWDPMGDVYRTADASGGVWTASSGSVDSNFITGGACVGRSLCVLVDNGGDAVISDDGGVTWSVQTTDSGNSLTSVSCPSTSFCAAADAQSGSSSAASDVLLTSDPTDPNPQWASTRVPGYGVNVSCADATLCVAQTSQGVVVGTSHPIGAPTAVTGQTQSDSETMQTLGATVNPNGDPVSSCEFAYGTSSAYGSTAPCSSSPGAGTSPVNVTAQLSGLTPGTTYHYAIIADNSYGQSVGMDATFTTGSTGTTGSGGSGGASGGGGGGSSNGGGGTSGTTGSAGSAGSDNGDGAPAAAAGCKLPSVTVPGVGVLTAGCFTKGAAGSYSATGRVRFNGLDIEPVNASTPFKLTITPASATLTLVGSAQFKIGSIVVWKSSKEKLSYQLKVPGAAKARLVLSDIQQRVQASLKGFPLQGDVSLDFSPDGGGTISATVHVALQKPIPNVTGDATLSLSNASGLHIDSLEFKVPQATLGPISIKNLDVSYQRSSDTWQGSLTASFPVTPRELTVTAGGKFVHGQFDSAYAYAKGLGITLANPTVFLNDLSLTVSREPKFDGSVAVTAGPELQLGSNKLRLLGLTGEFLYEAPNGQSHFRLSGNVVLLNNWGHVSGAIDYWPATTTLTFGGGFNFPDSGFPFPTYGFSASGGLYGGFKPNGFEVEGQATLKWQQQINVAFVHQTLSFEQGAQGVISDQGIAVCHTGWPDVGLGFTWSSHDFTAFGSNCDISPWRSRAFASRVRAHVAAFAVRRGLPFEAFNLLGPAGDPPSVTIHSPSGQSVSTTSDFQPVLNSDFLVMQIPNQNGQSRTFIEARDPSPGDWRITPNPGSAPILAAQQADPLPDPAVHANLIGPARNRRLVWSLHPLAGQSVSFVETGSQLSRVITTTDRAHGRLRFLPAAGHAGIRTILAEITQNGLPRRVESVLRFRASGQPRPARVQGLRVLRRGQRLTFRWRGAAHASGYELQAALSDGTRVTVDLPSRQHTYTINSVDPATTLTASIRATSALGGYGQPTHLSTKSRPLLMLQIPTQVTRGRRLLITATALQAGSLYIVLLDQRGTVLASTRTRIARRGSRHLSISVAAVRPHRYTVLANYVQNASFKPLLQTRTLIVR